MKLNKNTLKQKICYIHVAKCGGTSFVDAVRNSYPLHHRLLRPKWFVTMDATASLKGSQILDEDLWSYRERLLFYFLSIKSNRFVAGHFPISDRVLKSFDGEWRFVTIIRHPVDRWFSHYFFNRYKRQGHFKTDVSLEDYIESDDGGNIGTLYHQIFGGFLRDNSIDLEESYDKAIKNLQKMDCIGIVEDNGKFLKDFKGCFGVTLNIENKNRNPLSGEERSKMITDEIRAKAQKICEPDMKIYKFILRMIHSR